MDKSSTKTPYKCSVLPTAELNAEIKLPSSKSISNRALIINALAGSKEIPENVSDCDDTFVMIRALKEMGDTIDIMAAGTSMRFLTAYLSITEGVRTITGTERMKNRPIGILVDALRSMGANIEYAEKEGFPP
ncbi:MAG: 3-phosphoshikimate 1-carboxyvinyltransferase, partial [Bacteroidaceae bacterium]|nr:3-phosphoshikimate 1-carboxyvinyltransferase [Bacteroidaceae bacterium]